MLVPTHACLLWPRWLVTWLPRAGCVWWPGGMGHPPHTWTALYYNTYPVSLLLLICCCCCYIPYIRIGNLDPVRSGKNYGICEIYILYNQKWQSIRRQVSNRHHQKNQYVRLKGRQRGIFTSLVSHLAIFSLFFYIRTFTIIHIWIHNRSYLTKRRDRAKVLFSGMN